jgi:DNA-binding GntR family transcriptional regulator
MSSSQLVGPAKPALVADQVSEVISNAIFTGELPGGSRLRIRDLAAMCGTSVMPVRDAIRRLEEEGLATSSPHKGAIVRDFTTAELLEIYDVRLTLEVEATRKGTPRVTEDAIEAMRASCARMQQAVSEERVQDALDEDESLLRHLYSAAGNSVLMGLIETLWLQCRPYKMIGATAAIQAGDQSLWTPQPELVEAVARRDVRGAMRITRDSVISARRRLEATIDH